MSPVATISEAQVQYKRIIHISVGCETWKPHLNENVLKNRSHFVLIASESGSSNSVGKAVLNEFQAKLFESVDKPQKSC